MRTRFICIFAALFAVCSLAMAQNKVIESSSKKAPEWINTAVDGYIVVSVDAATLAAARTQAMNEVTERIILSVASNVSVSMRNEMSEVVTNDNVDSNDSFSRLSKMKSANLPFLKGISESKIKEVYWQHVRNKKTGKEYYEYSVLYPFTNAEHRSLVAQFEKLDAEKVAQLKQLEDGIDNIVNIEDIKSSLTSLAALKEYFFDDVRQKETEGLMARYRQLYDALSVTGAFVNKGTYRCQVLLKGNPVGVGKMPTVKSNCASQISVRPDNGAFVITYDDADCLPEEENFLDILFRLDGKKLEHKAYLSDNRGSIAGGNLSVVPEGKVVLSAAMVDKDSRTVTNVTIRMSLNNRNGSKFGLRSIEMNVPDLAVPLVIDDIDAVYSSAGIIQVKALAQGELTVNKVKTSNFAFVTGYITVANEQTGAIEKIKISLPYSTNWE